MCMDCSHERPDISEKSIFGPYLRFGNYDSQTYLWTASVLIVSCEDLPPTVTYSSISGAGGNPQGVILDTYSGFKFVRFAIEIPLEEKGQILEYTVDNHGRYKKRNK